MFWFIVAIILLVLLVAAFAVNSYVYGNDDFWPKQGIPLASGPELFGSFWERIRFKIPFHELDLAVYKKLKSLAAEKSTPFGGFMEFRRPVAFLLDLDLIKNVMVKDFDHFVNRRRFGRKDDPTLFHKMLFSMENPEWKNLRATLSPTFTTGKIRKMFGVFEESSEKLATFLKDELKKRKTSDIEMRDVCGRYTMDVIASAAFGVDSQNFKDKNSTFALMGYKIQNQFSGWIGNLKLFMSFLSPKLFALLRFTFMDVTAFTFFKDVALKTVHHRDTTGQKRNDFLQLMMESRAGENLSAVANDDEDGLEVGGGQKAVKIPITEDLLIAQCILFFFAGFDATESLLIYAAYELALNPEMQDKLATELKEAVEKHGELSYDVVNQLEYLDMFISETLRKYPPAVRTERKCTRDYKIPGTNLEFKKDQVVAIPIYAIHHDEEFYPEPEKFIPERFSKENKLQRNPYSYMPFGHGPRNCIANRFAITEGKAAIAHLCHNFVLQPTARTTIPMKFSVTGNLKPIDGMWLNVTPRN